MGSLLNEAEVDRDRALNLLGDPLILDCVDERVPRVRACGGTLDEHRLRHNMLSSMPMAFSFACALGGTADSAAVVCDLFGVDCVAVTSVPAEWTPCWPREDLLADRTAFDMAILYRESSGRSGLIGIETKYTERLSQREYFSDRYVEVTEGCGWFRPGASVALRASATNQLWRNTMLACVSESLCADRAHLGVIGLAEDTTLWNATRSVQAQMNQPDRVIPVAWERVIELLEGSSLASFGALFRERYLDLRPIAGHPSIQ